MKTPLFDTSALQSRATSHQLPPFKVKQIFFELFKNQRIHREEMTTLSKDLKAELAQSFTPLSLSIIETVKSDTTTKFVFQTLDGYIVEAMLMLHRQDEKYAPYSATSPRKVAGRKLNRITLCISSQVGCPVNCLFCITGKLGFTRNLSWDEIISQILYANRRIQQQFGKKEDGSLRAVRNVVFMGMGEPLLNYDNVIQSIEIMLAQERLSLGRRHITISTAGIIPGIKRLIADKVQVKLALSLHAPHQVLREKLMPIAKAYPLPALMEVIDEYVAATDNRIFYEYIMIKGITDTPALAHELVSLLAGRLAHVNLIPYNPNPVLDFLESDVKNIQLFKQILEKG
ncbi:MAG: 23S rRNA (adenine(2503)-C(2))-methyltransferase RlmN [Candidatus Peribacteria bacterium]|jgi:23S rRNA (adenine2503-C2)-methyltransferase|nr:23S rRNA (adenine(2503)-C(2))-methyltransferase RlmN [Candidatus Peribacteria bacterium]